MPRLQLLLSRQPHQQRSMQTHLSQGVLKLFQFLRKYENVKYIPFLLMLNTTLPLPVLAHLSLFCSHCIAYYFVSLYQASLASTWMSTPVHTFHRDGRNGLDWSVTPDFTTTLWIITARKSNMKITMLRTIWRTSSPMTVLDFFVNRNVFIRTGKMICFICLFIVTRDSITKKS